MSKRKFHKLTESIDAVATIGPTTTAGLVSATSPNSVVAEK